MTNYEHNLIRQRPQAIRIDPYLRPSRAKGGRRRVDVPANNPDREARICMYAQRAERGEPLFG